MALGVNELGDQVPLHRFVAYFILTLGKAEAISAEVKDGIFRILFAEKRFGVYQSYLSDHFLKAIEAAPREGFSLVAKHSIENDYDAEIEELTEKIGSILNMPDVVLDPNWEENYAKLKKKDDQSWQSTFGQAAFAYFE